MQGSHAAHDRVLVVDDEEDLCRLIEFNLRDAGFDVDVANAGAPALQMAAAMHPQVVVLDLMLPDIPGGEICRRLRADEDLKDIAIMIVTARGDEYDRVVGFELGADDYVVKPFSVRELVLRVRALARRGSERQTAFRQCDTGKRMWWRDLEVDPIRMRTFIRGVELKLRPLELKILLILMEHPGRVFSRQELLEEAWDAPQGVGPRTVDTQIQRLRENLGTHHEAIETVHGFGYRLREP
jgi:two-component system phosphate regulon response regulator PhoB